MDEAIDKMIEAINHYMKAKQEYNKAYDEYEGYSWDWAGHFVIEDLESAQEDMRTQFKAAIKLAVQEELAERESDEDSE